jgi:hypothetical protein
MVNNVSIARYHDVYKYTIPTSDMSDFSKALYFILNKNCGLFLGCCGKDLVYLVFRRRKLGKVKLYNEN